MQRYALLILIILCSSCTSLIKYSENNKPKYLSNKFQATEEIDSSLKIICFNIEKSEKIDLAIKELKEDKHTEKIDILFLQEMDENGVIQIADSFNLNYIYFPFTKDPHSQKNFGNAVLSKFEIKQPQKLILPHLGKNNRLRAATKCQIEINNETYLLYSIHQSTVTMKDSKRVDQLNALMMDLEKEYKNFDQIIIGGDFNTLFKRDLKRTVRKFEAQGFEFATSGIGHTSAALFNIVKPLNDHIFIKKGQVIKKGKLKNSKSSDHIPIYIELSI